MKLRNSQKALSIFLAVVMILACLVNPSTVALAHDTLENLLPQFTNYRMNGTFVHTAETQALTNEVTILVSLDSQTTYLATSDLEQAVADSDKHMAALTKAQRAIEAYVDQPIEVDEYFSLLFNGFAFIGPEWMITAINEMPGITAIQDVQLELEEASAAEAEDALTTSMTTANGMVGAVDAWELGYTGEGMVIAILDTGIRRTHEAFSVMPENGKIDIDYLQEVYTKYGNLMHGGDLEDVDKIYYSAKLPFNWDYAGKDADPSHTASDHGTHVAGIAAGNNGKGFKGVAPDAQIVTMQAFNADGSGSFYMLMQALEDCVYLGVDAVNMSLGSPAGFTAYESILAYYENIYAALEKAGITIACAGGNQRHTGQWTNFSDYFRNKYYWAAWNPDVGTINAPATFPGSLGVASVVNTNVSTGSCINAYGNKYYPISVLGCPSLNDLGEGELDMVYVGLGSPEEIAAAGDVTGKIALVKRGDLTFAAKIQNVTAAGAIGCIIFNNDSASFQLAGVTSTVPLAVLSGADGEALVASLPDGVHGTVSIRKDFNTKTVTMASNSSWGTTADLRITPEISAPGHNIYSSLGLQADTTYGVYSGTSMATPNVAGGMLLIKQRLRELYPDATVTEINELAYTIAMSTANQVTGFVRQQGAGMINLPGALSTNAYITVPGANRPKLELDDSENGTFTFSFQVTNFGSSTKTYAVSFSAMTEQVSEMLYSGYVMGEQEWNKETGFHVANPEETLIKVLNGTIKDVTAMCDLTGPETVTVPAGETVTVTMTLTAGDELMQYFMENCEVGMYLEGHIVLEDTDIDGVDLSVPYLGFVGDWDYAPMFDLGMYWNIPWGENNMSQMTTTQGTYVGYGILEQGLGMNPYVNTENETYLADRNAISPNGDDYLDAVNYIEFSLMRNPKYVKLYIQDADGNMIADLTHSQYGFYKEYYADGYNGGLGYSYLNFNYDASKLAENETFYLVLEAWLDHEEYDPADNMNGRMIFPVTKDTVAPAVRAVAGGLEIQDANYIAYYAVYADAAMTELLYETGVFAETRNVAEMYKTDADELYVKVADYAHNEATYAVIDGLVISMEDALPGREIVCRTYFDWLTSQPRYAWTQINSETHVDMEYLTSPTSTMNSYAQGTNGNFDYMDAMVGVDGTVYVAANAKFTDIYTMDPDTFELTLMGTVWSKDTAYARIRNFVVDPDTYEVYVFGSTTRHDNWMFSLDLETLEMVPLYEFVNISDQDALSATEWAVACIGNGQVALWGHYNWLGIYDLATGEPVRVFSFNVSDKYNCRQLGINGITGTMLYDEANNDLLLFSNWMWFRGYRYNTQGMAKIDLDTDTITLHSVGNGLISFHGMYFADELDGAPFWQVQELIKAIGQVTADSAETIRAAREAYDALPENEKAMVENYADLTMAENALDVCEQIHAIGQITLDSGDAIQAAKLAFSALSADEQALVSNYAYLITAENVWNVQTLVNSIGQVSATSGAAIKAAAEAYNALSESEKALVINATELRLAEQAFAILELEESNFQSALYYARMVQLSLNDYNTSSFSPQQMDAFQTAKTAFGAAVKSAENVDAVHAALDALFTVLESLDALHAHNSVVINATEATCTQAGYTGDKVCEYCDTVLETGKAISMLPHEAELRGQVEQTCTQDGYTGDEVCKLCGHVTKEGQLLPMLPHEEVLTGYVEQTCTEDGYTGDSVCQLCEQVITAGQAIPAVCENAGFAYVSNNNGTHIRKTTCCDAVVDGDAPCAYGESYTCELCGYKKAAMTVTVTDGTISGENGTSLTVYESRTVTVTANAAPDGKVFKGWQMNGQLVSTDSIYTFQVTENANITALYEDADTTDALVTGIMIACLVILAAGEFAIFFLLRKKKTN